MAPLPGRHPKPSRHPASTTTGSMDDCPDPGAPSPQTRDPFRIGVLTPSYTCSINRKTQESRRRVPLHRAAPATTCASSPASTPPSAPSRPRRLARRHLPVGAWCSDLHPLGVDRAVSACRSSAGRTTRRSSASPNGYRTRRPSTSDSRRTRPGQQDHDFITSMIRSISASRLEIRASTSAPRRDRFLTGRPPSVEALKPLPTARAPRPPGSTRFPEAHRRHLGPGRFQAADVGAGGSSATPCSRHVHPDGPHSPGRSDTLPALVALEVASPGPSRSCRAATPASSSTIPCESSSDHWSPAGRPVCRQPPRSRARATDSLRYSVLPAAPSTV